MSPADQGDRRELVFSGSENRYGSVVGVGFRLMVLGPSLGTLRGTLEPMIYHDTQAYSARASLTSGILASASFHSRSSSSYALYALATTPAIVQALASCSRARAPIGSSSTTPGCSRIFWNSAAASAALPSATYDMPRT